ncbi:MAG TPA: FG-GAP-like repeat-containing protein [Gaiellaceae bacterium]|nr:FG-GAP-like repeat-containing protein [Gaiellaceae bacterium]
MAAVAIRGTTYPVVLPKLRDPRLHLAATITSLQVLGQVAFHFKLSIAQILISLGTVAVIEIVITAWKQHVLMWPASALLTGNGVAFVLRVPGTRHGDWWTAHGWWIYVATAGGALLSKYVIRWKGEHVFNPSNIGLVVVFLALGRTRVEPLDFWWGPMSWWMALALVIIVSGGFTILRRLELLRVALSFWAAFAVGIGFLALGGHAMTARWHLGPVDGFQFWWILVTSPEVLVFFFFMITDPKTAPRDLHARIFYGIVLGFLASALIAPTTTEFAAKVALLSSLAIVCAAKALPIRLDQRVVVYVASAGAVIFTATVAFANSGIAHVGPVALPSGHLPAIKIDASPGVQTQLDLKTAEQIAFGVVRTQPAHVGDVMHVHLVPGTDQSPPTAVAHLAGVTYRLSQNESGTWTLTGAPPVPRAQPTLASSALKGTRLVNIAPSVGLDFTQGSFSSGVTNEVKAMMGGGVCWIDYNNDGWLDLFAVNSYAGADTVHPSSELFENRHGHFSRTSFSLTVQGDGCAAADLNGDGWTDLVVSTTTDVEVLWNDHGTFSEQTLPAPSGWYTGVAIADVNGDGKLDVFAAGYSDPNQPVPGSVAGFPTNLEGVRDVLFVNGGGKRFREAGVAAGLEASSFRHGLGAEFMDVNGDGRPDLYVANDEDPNQLYVDIPWPGGAAADPAGLGFRFEDRATNLGVADPFAGMGIAAGDGRLLVTNSRGEPSAAYRGPRFANDRANVDGALGTGFAGWGASWVDLANTGTDDLVLTAGAIPVKSLARDAEPLRVLAPASGSKFGVAPVLTGIPRRNGRGLAVADAFNDGREVIAVNSIGGKLLLLQPTGPSGHWLDVSVTPATPGTVVTAVLPSGRRITKTITAGSSYLSSDDPRLHFGLGSARSVRLSVNGGSLTPRVRADRVFTVRFHKLAVRATTPGCTPVTRGRSVARIWNDAAVASLRLGNATDAVQARDLYDLSALVARAPRAGAAISYAAYRLLVWQASYNENLGRTFALLTRQLQALCLDPRHGSALADATIRADAHDGSNEALHFADPTFTPQNTPLIVAQPGSTVHDATFWQPLSFGKDRVQTFTDSQWGRVKTYGIRARVGPPKLGDPSSKAYRDAAIAGIRATASGTRSGGKSPADWNRGLPSLGLALDIKLDLELNGALNDAAVSVYAAKREYDAPRPISMIRYLAFNDQLPLVAGLTRRVGRVTQVRLDGRWVNGNRWSVATPASPGYPSETAAYAYAASVVLRRPVAAAPSGTELPVDIAAGKQIGLDAGRAALRR